MLVKPGSSPGISGELNGSHPCAYFIVYLVAILYFVFIHCPLDKDGFLCISPFVLDSFCICVVQYAATRGSGSHIIWDGWPYKSWNKISIWELDEEVNPCMFHSEELLDKGGNKKMASLSRKTGKALNSYLSPNSRTKKLAGESIFGDKKKWHCASSTKNWTIIMIWFKIKILPEIKDSWKDVSGHFSLK